tara:strand:+ start:941 stop:1489 length:549 start_codon:yes stop_codon:yes gene_type:complete
MFVSVGFATGAYLVHRDMSDGFGAVTYGKIPRFELIDQKEEPFTFKDLNNEVWVANFICTTCAGPCTSMSEIMASLHKQLNYEHDIHTVSITVNPEYDNAQILKTYSDRYDADHDRWHFVTGSRDKIKELAVDGFHIGVKEDVISHSTLFVLVDQNRIIRGYYNGTELDEIKKLVRDVKRLL